jgi:hypothetical protein
MAFLCFTKKLHKFEHLTLGEYTFSNIVFYLLANGHGMIKSERRRRRWIKQNLPKSDGLAKKSYIS